MSEVITISNQKGGVGKSTTASAILGGLRKRGYKALCIDLDPQCNLTYSMGAIGYKNTSLEVLKQEVSAIQAIQETEQGDIIPAGQMLGAAETMITGVGKEYLLREALEPLKDLYDYIIIDTPPALGILTVNALTASDSVIIPAQADIYSLQGIGQLNKTIQTVKKYCNPALRIKGLLITRYNGRSILSRDMKDMITQTAEKLGSKVYPALIRECTALKEAQTMKRDIFSYAPKSNGAKDYEELIEDMLKD